MPSIGNLDEAKNLKIPDKPSLNGLKKTPILLVKHKEEQTK